MFRVTIRTRMMSLRPVFIVVTTALIVHLAGTWILPLIDRDETFYAEVSREMNQRGDYLVPHFNNEAWLEKPPLLYWCQSVSFRVFGDNEFGARFPGVVASVLSALVVFGFCSRFHEQGVAVRAAILFTLCAEMVIFGTAGVTDMLATLFVTIAAWAGWELLDRTRVRTDKSRRFWWWTFYLALALTFLAKGPLLILPLGGLFVFWKWARVPDFFRIMKFGRGLALVAALCACWLVPVLVKTKGELFSVLILREVLRRFVVADHGHGASSLLHYLLMLPFYFLLVFPAFFPWSLWLPKTLSRFRRQRSETDIYLVSCVLFTFLLFTLPNTKLIHYTLPAFPILACLVAPVIPELDFRRWAVIMAAFNVGVSFLLFPLAARYSATFQLAQALPLPKETEFASTPGQEPGMIWNFRKHVQGFKTEIKENQIAGYLNKPGPRLCVLRSEAAARITPEPGWKVVAVRGFNVVKGRRNNLTMFVKER